MKPGGGGVQSVPLTNKKHLAFRIASKMETAGATGRIKVPRSLQKDSVHDRGTPSRYICATKTHRKRERKASRKLPKTGRKDFFFAWRSFASGDNSASRTKPTDGLKKLFGKMSTGHGDTKEMGTYHPKKVYLQQYPRDPKNPAGTSYVTASASPRRSPRPRETAQAAHPKTCPPVQVFSVFQAPRRGLLAGKIDAFSHLFRLVLSKNTNLSLLVGRTMAEKRRNLAQFGWK
jgi:hypothetical protein